jgi:hypothetical protein
MTVSNLPIDIGLKTNMIGTSNVVAGEIQQTCFEEQPERYMVISDGLADKKYWHTTET